MSELHAHQIISLSLAPLCQAQAIQFAKPFPLVEWQLKLEDLMNQEALPTVKVILCGPPPEDVKIAETAQLLRMKYPELPIYFLTIDRTGFDRKELIKNGFTDAYLLPIDSAVFKQAIETEVANAAGGKIKNFRSVKLVDIQAGQAMDFDTFVHMPVNNKYIRYSASGDPIDPERAQKLAQHKVGKLHVHQHDLKKFYEFTAQQLKNLGRSDTMSETEKRNRMQTAVRDLVSDIFQDSPTGASFARGKEVAQDCQQIVKAYIVATATSGSDTSWYDRLLALSSDENSAYTHSANVATFASLFSMGLGVGNPEQLAMAGLLHDIGMAEVPAALHNKAESTFAPEEYLIFQKHSKASVALLQARRMVVPEIVLTMIAQHHERYDGTGFPDQVKGVKFKPESQILAMADEFCELTAIRPGATPMTPQQAIQRLHDSIPTEGDAHHYDPELVRKLYALFKPST